MKRRQLVAGTAAALALSGCTGGNGDDSADDETDDRRDDTGDDTGDDPTPPANDHPRSGEGAAGRIDPIGHAVADEPPFYTFAHPPPSGEWAVLGSFPTDRSQVASTLFDCSDLDEPTIAHELDTSDETTWTNDVKFDPLRDGIYYRSLEGQFHGIEVVDFGWEEGSPDEPEILAHYEAPNTGVHKLTTHPEEPICYLVDLDPGTDAGVIVVDVSTPESPETVDAVGPPGGCHDVEYDPVRELLHAAYIMGSAEGYVIYDASDPYELVEVGHFAYDGEPNYTALGRPGFQYCHQADYDPGRDLAVIGDEVSLGIPGGKHVFDIGWDEGTVEDPRPIGFTHSPDAREMDAGEQFWWTTHFHDVVTMDDETLLVDGGYRQGVWVCSLADPTEPTPTERIATISGAEVVSGDVENRVGVASPPYAWVRRTTRNETSSSRVTALPGCTPSTSRPRRHAVPTAADRTDTPTPRR